MNKFLAIFGYIGTSFLITGIYVSKALSFVTGMKTATYVNGYSRITDSGFEGGYLDLTKSTCNQGTAECYSNGVCCCGVRNTQGQQVWVPDSYQTEYYFRNSQRNCDPNVVYTEAEYKQLPHNARNPSYPGNGDPYLLKYCRIRNYCGYSVCIYNNPESCTYGTSQYNSCDTSWNETAKACVGSCVNVGGHYTTVYGNTYSCSAQGCANRMVPYGGTNYASMNPMYKLEGLTSSQKGILVDGSSSNFFYGVSCMTCNDKAAAIGIDGFLQAFTVNKSVYSQFYGTNKNINACEGYINDSTGTFKCSGF
ncbi:MAG: hypothetical protein LBJ73_03010 [Rickettsiales bacterium]|jgi:hypothetical protein|nr:hypothetical protein [Rickettsiales bacterium]